MTAQTDEQIHAPLLKLLEKKPELYDIMVNVLYCEKDCIANNDQIGWEWYQARLHTSTLKQLILDNVVKVSFKSNNTTAYRLVNPQRFESTLTAYEKLQRQTLTEEPATFPTDIFDVIIGYDYIKQLLMRSLRGAKPVHVLMLGPPSTAKSLFMLELARLPKCRFILGHTTSKQGLTRWLMENRPAYLLVDELDKMDREDFASLISLMETGILTEMKVGRTETVELKTWVFATANRDERLPPELRSRFLIVRLHDYSQDDFTRVVTLVLQRREKTPAELANYIADKLKTRTKDVRDAIKVARLCSTTQDVDRLLETAEQYGLFGGSDP